MLLHPCPPNCRLAILPNSGAIILDGRRLFVRPWILVPGDGHREIQFIGADALRSFGWHRVTGLETVLGDPGMLAIRTMGDRVQGTGPRMDVLGVSTEGIAALQACIRRANASRLVAALMANHPRLGRDSLLGQCDDGVLRLILSGK